MKMPTTKSKLSILITLPLAVLFLWFLFGHEYLLMECSDNVSTIWHDDEAFIFVGKFTAGINEKIWKVEAASLFNPWGIGGFAETFHEDLIVFHIKGDKLEQYYLKDCRYASGYPFGGKLYIASRDNHDAVCTMQFTGTNFIIVSESEVSKIENQFPPLGSVEHDIDEQIKKEGWQNNTSMGYLFKNGPYLLKLQNFKLTIMLKEDEAYSPQSVILEGRLGNDFRETLFYNDKCHYRWVTKETFLMAKEK